jgi:hypothetical protein
VQNQIGRSTRDLANPIYHSITVGRYLRTEITQAARIGFACGCNHMCAIWTAANPITAMMLLSVTNRILTHRQSLTNRSWSACREIVMKFVGVFSWQRWSCTRKPGYETTTAAEIAARAGVTERTFFRHSPDKREVLFDGESLLSDALTSAVRSAPVALGPWDTLFRSFRSVVQLFVDNRAFSEPRRRIIASSPALQERELTKVGSLIGTLASALCERGVPDPPANLA